MDIQQRNLRKKFREVFELELYGKEPYKPEEKGTFGMFLEGVWYKLKIRETDNSDPVSRLDVSILQNKVLEPILGITDPRTDQRIQFVGGIRGLKVFRKRCCKWRGFFYVSDSNRRAVCSF